MKKHFTLFFSISTLVVNFACFWYSDALLDRFFVFAVIPYGISIIMLAQSLILSVAFTIRYPSIIKNYIALAISLITILLIFVFPFRTAKVKLELSLYGQDREQIVEMVKNGELVSDHIGNTELPKGYGRLSSDGSIFVYQNDSEQVISFWVFRGMLSGSVQLIYSSQDERLIYKNETGHPITSIIKLKEHWYLVKTDY